MKVLVGKMEPLRGCSRRPMLITYAERYERPAEVLCDSPGCKARAVYGATLRELKLQTPLDGPVVVFCCERHAPPRVRRLGP